MAEEKSKKELKKILKNPWAIATVVLAVLLLIVYFSGSGISKSTAGEKTLEFLNSQVGEGVELIEVNSEGSFYEVVVLFQSQQVPVYITKDGNHIAQGIMPLSAAQDQPAQQQPTPTEVPKSDKPEVELFVMTHCPYGTQAEKGYLPAIKSLGNKIDASVKFVHYFLHEPENDETPIQVCIREEQSSKFLPYLECFLEDGDSDRCQTKVGIDKSKLNTCTSTKADGFYATDSALSEGYGVRGSPTLIINGVESNAGRSAASYLAGICASFTDGSRPSERDTLELDATNPSAGFGYNAGTTGAATASC